jgi:hypothetical protein
MTSAVTSEGPKTQAIGLSRSATAVGGEEAHKRFQFALVMRLWRNKTLAGTPSQISELRSALPFWEDAGWLVGGRDCTPGSRVDGVETGLAPLCAH